MPPPRANKRSSIEPSSAVVSVSSSAETSASESEADDTSEQEQKPSAEPFNGWPQFTPSDTYAQWIVAGLALIGTIISAWAVILLRSTLRLNRKATGAATLATRAAIRGAKAAERAYLSDNRPWIKLAPTSIGPIDFAKGTVEAQFKVENVGKSPALNVRVLVQGYIVRIVQPDKTHIARLVTDYLKNAPHNVLMSALVFPNEPLETRSEGRIAELAAPNGNPTVEVAFALVCTAVYRSSLGDTFFHTSMTYMVKDEGQFLQTDRAYESLRQDMGSGETYQLDWMADPRLTSVS